MSQPCVIISCKRNSRAICHCCQQNVCIQHLNEHNEALNSQLGPLADQINILAERLRTINIQDIVGDCREKLEQWRKDSHTKIDEYFERKYLELDRLVSEKLNEQREDVTQLRSKVAELIRDQEATRQDIETFTSTIRRLEKRMNEAEQTRFQITACPFLIKDSTVQFYKMHESWFDLSNLASAYKTIKYLPDSRSLLANNDRLLLIQQASNLCFLDTQLRIVKQVLWPHDLISKICWSAILNRFIAVVKDSIFLIDENTMSISKTSIPGKQPWFSCSCFNNQLFLSTNTWGSSIIEAILSPSITIVKEWKSPTTCTMDELIDDMVHSNETLALMIRSKVEKSMRIELRSSETLDRLWSLGLDGVYGTAMAFRCCSIDQGGWLLADHGAGRLLHVTADGKVKRAIPYESIPYIITLFDSNILAVTTKSCINFHKI